MTSHLPIACTLTPDELRRRRDALLPGIIARASRYEWLEDGFRFHFAPADGLVPAIAAIDVTGPAGTADFLAPWVPAP